LRVLTRGILQENPIFYLVLGICSALAVTTKLENALAMGFAVTFVIVISSALVSLIRKHIPAIIRLASYMIVITSLTTIIVIYFEAFDPAMYRTLGIYLPLVAINCIILGRAEAYASRNTIIPSVLDSLGYAIGYTWVISLVSLIRQLLGTGSITIFDIQILTISYFQPLDFMIRPPGALFTLGVLSGLIAFLRQRRAQSSRRRR